MRSLKQLGEFTMALKRKRPQHYIDMDGFKCYYEQIGSRHA